MANASHDPGAREYYETIFNVRTRGKQQLSEHCPFHDDKSKSLSVNLETGLWNCHACGLKGNRAQFAALYNALTASAHHSTMLPTASAHSAPSFASAKLEDSYPYTDGGGELLFVKERYRRPNGEKTFLCRAWNGKALDGDMRRLTQKPDWVPQLFNLCGMQSADVTTLVKTEGEKDARNLIAILPKTHAAFTNYEGSANKWYPEYAKLVAGKHVVVSEHNDEAGRKHAAFWADACQDAGAKSVKVDRYAGEREKYDVSDYLEANPRANMLKRWAALPAWVSPGQERFLTLPALLAEMPAKVDWFWEGRIPSGSAVLLTGANKIGKSTFVHGLVRGRRRGLFLGRAIKAGRTVYLTEMSAEDVKAECADCPGLGEDESVFIVTQNKCWDWDWETALQQAFRKCRAAGADLLIVDTFNSWTLLENPNDTGQTLRAYHLLRKFLEAGIAVLLIDHEGIEQRDIGTARRGSTSLAGQMSVVLSLRHLPGKREPETRLRQLVRTGRHGTSTETLEWRANDYVFLGTSASVAADSAAEKLSRVLPSNKDLAKSLAALMKETGCTRGTLQRALAEKVKYNTVQVTGPARRRRYWIHPAHPLHAETSKKKERKPARAKRNTAKNKKF